MTYNKFVEIANTYAKENEKYEKEHPEETVIYYIYGCSGADHDTRSDAAQKISIDEAKQMLSERHIHGITLYNFTGNVECISIDFDEYDEIYIPLHLIKQGNFGLW